MAKRRKRNNAFGQIASSLSMLVGFGAFVAGLSLFDGMNSGQQLLFSTLFGAVAMIGSALILLMIKRLVVRDPRSDETFDFDAVPQNKLQEATKFEHDVARLIQQITGKKTEVVGGSGDGGVDVNVYDEKRKLIGIVQCKHVKPGKTVSPSYIRELNSVRHYHHVNIAYLVTTGRFSKDSYSLAKELGVRLIDGERLKKMTKQVQPANVE